MKKSDMFDKPMDYTVLTEKLNQLRNTYCIDVGSIGKSFLERELWCVTLGHGQKVTLYCGAHHAQEWVTTQLLMRFIEDFSEADKNGGIYRGYKTSQVLDKCKIVIVPMLNPDGVELGMHGISKEHPFYERLLRLNNGSDDFSSWQANIRGVDLNHNYNAGWGEAKMLERQYGIFGGGPTRYGGEYPESEPETAAMCRYVRTNPVDTVVALHSQGEEIYYDFEGYTPPEAMQKAQIISKITGYKLSRPEGIAAGGGFKDWFIDKFDRPGYTLEVGLGKNPLPISDFASIYSKLNDFFIMLPML